MLKLDLRNNRQNMNLFLDCNVLDAVGRVLDTGLVAVNIFPGANGRQS